MFENFKKAISFIPIYMKLNMCPNCGCRNNYDGEILNCMCRCHRVD